MKITDLTVNIMNRLGAIPGLSFIGGYVSAAKATHTRFGQRKGDYEAYIGNVRGIGDDVKEATGAPGQHGGAEGAGGEDDESEFEYDESDDYGYDEDDDNDFASGGGGAVDDYPASDVNNSYYDDDYRSQ